MRSQLQKFLPIVLIALAMQILAPVAACWASAIAASDPLQNAVICHDSSVSGQSEQPGEQAAHAASCSICCLAQANAWLNAPQPGVTISLRHADRVVWHSVASGLDVSRVGSNAQARAPPRIS
ncbi:MAG: DUF2946 domain-containing protein [Bradyrhizobium sp.]|uniref:DUF2946 domain-containing protein n=1 Tax=Bradyrhizobium sp. TaxID=376 RepID=UPI0025B7C81A|nr:DUF2946 domain-containing protein [Bradyrhizobium sp.]MBI5265222.1 DUF2946 domain-containing protein [Bradyrhizobium sp.]